MLATSMQPFVPGSMALDPDGILVLGAPLPLPGPSLTAVCPPPPENDGQGHPKFRDAGFGIGPRERSTGNFSFHAFLERCRSCLQDCHCLPGPACQALPVLSPGLTPDIVTIHLASRKTSRYFTEKTLATPGALRPPKKTQEAQLTPLLGVTGPHSL